MVSVYCKRCHLLLAPFEPRVKYLDFVFHGHCLHPYIKDILDRHSAEFKEPDDKDDPWRGTR